MFMVNVKPVLVGVVYVWADSQAGGQCDYPSHLRGVGVVVAEYFLHADDKGARKDHIVLNFHCELRLFHEFMVQIRT